MFSVVSVRGSLSYDLLCDASKERGGGPLQDPASPVPSVQTSLYRANDQPDVNNAQMERL